MTKEIIEKNIPCKEIGNLSSDTVKLVINDCGTYIEKVRNGIPIWRHDKAADKSVYYSLPQPNKEEEKVL